MAQAFGRGRGCGGGGDAGRGRGGEEAGVSQVSPGKRASSGSESRCVQGRGGGGGAGSGRRGQGGEEQGEAQEVILAATPLLGKHAGWAHGTRLCGCRRTASTMFCSVLSITHSEYLGLLASRELGFNLWNRAWGAAKGAVGRPGRPGSSRGEWHAQAPSCKANRVAAWASYLGCLGPGAGLAQS